MKKRTSWMKRWNLFMKKLQNLQDKAPPGLLDHQVGSYLTSKWMKNVLVPASRPKKVAALLYHVPRPPPQRTHCVPKSGSLRGERALGNIVNQAVFLKNYSFQKKLCSLMVECSVFFMVVKK
jgi:hypothetical protein